jgi:hypothetical protein
MCFSQDLNTHEMHKNKSRTLGGNFPGWISMIRLLGRMTQPSRVIRVDLPIALGLLPDDPTSTGAEPGFKDRGAMNKIFCYFQFLL